MSINAGRDKVAYSWISLNPTKARPIVGGGVVVINI